MEWLFVLLVLFLYFGGYKLIWKLILAGSSASQEPPVLSVAPNPTMQLSDGYEPKLNLPIKIVQFKGKIPLTEPSKITFITSAVDITNEGAPPCLFPFDAFQEKRTLAFQQRFSMDRVFNPGDYANDWIRVGTVFPSLLHPPFSGTRTVQIVLRIIKDGQEEIVKSGYCKDGTPGMVWAGARNFQIDFKTKGYVEEKKNRREAAILAITLAMAISSADGRFDDEEGEVIQDWIKKHVNSASPSEQDSLKRDMNTTVEKAFQDGMSTGIRTDQVIVRLNEIGDKSSKFEVLELCFEVMSANGDMNPDEVALLKAYADLLELPKEEFQRLMDLHALNTSANTDPANDDERLLGIDPSWDVSEKLVFLRKEFRKWNSRMATLSDPEQRQVAQHRLDMIGRIRQKYENLENSHDEIPF